MGFEDKVEQSFTRPCCSDERQGQADMRSHLIIVPRGTSFHGSVELEFSFLSNSILHGFHAAAFMHRRTLSRVLAQPIYRDALLFGKFVAGLLTISFSLVALWLLVIGLGLLPLGVPPTAAAT